MTQDPGPVARQVREPTTDDVEAAHAVVAANLAPTPLVSLELPSRDGAVLAKLDSLQPTGSFKVRGALAALSAYGAAHQRVVTASAGNHGLGVVYAAARLGLAATVVVPETASAAKRDELRRLGADLVEHGTSYEAAEAFALRLAQAGATYVSPYNDPHVIAGQSTWVAEIAAAVRAEATLIVPVGGGGLIAGTAMAVATQPKVRVVGVEAAASRAVSSAVAAGRVVDVPVGETLADGLAGGIEPGCITPAIAARRVHSFVAVSEPEIAAAIRFLALRCGLVVEGSGAVGVAALLAGKVPALGQPIVLVTGRNIAAETLTRALG